jgi:hypothetical protein
MVMAYMQVSRNTNGLELRPRTDDGGGGGGGDWDEQRIVAIETELADHETRITALETKTEPVDVDVGFVVLYNADHMNTTYLPLEVDRQIQTFISETGPLLGDVAAFINSAISGAAVSGANLTFTRGEGYSYSVVDSAGFQWHIADSIIFSDWCRGVLHNNAADYDQEAAFGFDLTLTPVFDNFNVVVTSTTVPGSGYTKPVASNDYKTKQITSMSVGVVMTYHGTDPVMMAIAESFAQVGRRASVSVGEIYGDGTIPVI